MRARRVTIFRDRKGQWRYRVQAGNWKVIDAAEEGFARRSSIMQRIAARWPEAEIVEAKVPL